MFQVHTAGVVIGAGEVGESLFEALLSTYPSLKMHDIDPPEIPTYGGVVHICFPYFEGFEKTVGDWIKFHTENGRRVPDAVVIHSTVPVGVTKIVSDILPHIPVFHSPIRGKHPYLKESIKMFVKFIGPAGPAREDSVEQHAIMDYFREAGIQTYLCKDSGTTELMKLVSTTTYALLIAFHQEVERWCDAYGVNYEDIVTMATRTYNEGYDAVKEPQFRRPLIFPGFIGGHCLMPNVSTLRTMLKELYHINADADKAEVPMSLFLEAIVDSNERKGEEE